MSEKITKETIAELRGLYKKTPLTEEHGPKTKRLDWIRIGRTYLCPENKTMRTPADDVLSLEKIYNSVPALLDAIEERDREIERLKQCVDVIGDIACEPARTQKRLANLIFGEGNYVRDEYGFYHEKKGASDGK